MTATAVTAKSGRFRGEDERLMTIGNGLYRSSCLFLCSPPFFDDICG